MMAKDSGSLLTVRQAGEALGVSKACLDGWRCRGGGPRYLKIGRLVRYEESALAAWLESRRRVSTSDPGAGVAR